MTDFFHLVKLEWFLYNLRLVVLYLREKNETDFKERITVRKYHSLRSVQKIILAALFFFCAPAFQFYCVKCKEKLETTGEGKKMYEILYPRWFGTLSSQHFSPQEVK